MGWGNDPYYNPEKFGLNSLAVVSADLSYEFDITAAWVHEDGRIFWASDSGCSCPSPFEDYRSLEELGEITSHDDLRELNDHIMEGFRRYDPTEAVDFMATVARAFRQKGK